MYSRKRAQATRGGLSPLGALASSIGQVSRSVSSSVGCASPVSVVVGEGAVLVVLAAGEPALVDGSPLPLHAVSRNVSSTVTATLMAAG